MNEKRAEITLVKNDGMPEEYHYNCNSALQEALMQPKDELYEYADAVVKRLINDTDE